MHSKKWGIFKTLHPMQELELQAPAMEKQEFPENDSSLAS